MQHDIAITTSIKHRLRVTGGVLQSTQLYMSNAKQYPSAFIVTAYYQIRKEMTYRNI